MNQEDILKMAREAGFKANSFSPVIARHSNGSFVDMRPEVECFAALVAAKAAQDERQKHQADIDRWKGEAAKAEKWRGLALAKDGDGRTVQRVQQEAIDGFLELNSGIRVTRIELTEQQRAGLVADCKGPIPGVGEK